MTHLAVPYLHQILSKNKELKILKLNGNKFGDKFITNFVDTCDKCEIKL